MEITVLGSGSGGNSSIIKHKDTTILIDAGFVYKELVSKMEAKGINAYDINAIFITHEHGDHIRGVGKFMKKQLTTLYLTEKTYRAFNNKIKSDIGNKRTFLTYNVGVKVGDLSVKCFPVSHDAVDAVGYVVEDGSKKLSYITDLGYVTPPVKENLSDCDAIVIESNHDLTMLRNSSYHLVLKQRISGPKGHISNAGAAKLISEVNSDKLKNVFLTHLSDENNTPEVAMYTMQKAFNESDNKPKVIVTLQDESTEWVTV